MNEGTAMLHVIGNLIETGAMTGPATKRLDAAIDRFKRDIGYVPKLSDISQDTREALIDDERDKQMDIRRDEMREREIDRAEWDRKNCGERFE